VGVRPRRAAVAATEARRWLLVALIWFVALLGFRSSARAEGNTTTRASTEVAGYTDSVGVSVLTPSVGASIDNPTSGWGVNGRYLVDVVSAASPDIVATASPRWTEVRHAGNLGAKYKPGTFGIAGGGSASYSNDYLSVGGNASLTQELDGKNLTLVQSYGYGHDTIGRTGTPFNIFSRELAYHSIALGASRVVSPSVVLGFFANAILERGDQSKPYRYIPIFTPESAPTVSRGATVLEVVNQRLVARSIEQLPRARDRWAFTGRLAWRMEHTTVRLEERFYTDSWLMSASTTDFRYFIDAGKRVTFWPHIRLHFQGGVDFWQRAYSARDVHDLPVLRTGDRELGPLSSLGVGGGLRLALGKSGSEDDVVLTFSGDGTWTSFSDALYVRNRFSGIGTTALEVTF
jgi:hypothetical protein